MFARAYRAFFILFGITSIMLTAVAVPPGAAAEPQASSRDGSHRGQDAIDMLGTRLSAVATRHGMRSETLRQHLLHDPTLRVDRHDRLFYAEEPAPSGSSAPAAAAPFPDASTFLLHSKPGSNRTIYLDFVGDTIAGTTWNFDTGGNCDADPFDTDGNPASFSAAEHAIVQNAWRRISEDYAPFDVDVTTEEPPASALAKDGATDQVYGTRALFTSGSNVCPNGMTLMQSICTACGGVAVPDVFGDPWYQPAFVFHSDAKLVGEAGSHEIGHNAGLTHDGIAGGWGYYAGHGAWAPIMGMGSKKPIVQWSKGEYSKADNPLDDLDIIATHAAPLRSDDHGDTAITATPLAPGVPSTGMIGARTDVDAFTLTATGDLYTITATPAPFAPNLDIELQVRDGRGTVVASADPPSTRVNDDLASGLDASVSVVLPAGTYSVTVDGVGSGDPATTGYSDYGSLGAYTLSAVAAPPPPGAFSKTAPTSGTTHAALSGTALSWAAAPGAGSYEYCVDTTLDGACGAGWSPTGTATSATLPALAAGTTYEWQVRAVNANGTTAANTNTWWRFTTAAPPAAFAKTAPTKGATDRNPSSLTLQWSAAADTTSYEYCIDNTSGSTCTASWVSVGTSTSVTLTDLAGAKTYFWQVRAVNAVGTTYANASTWWYFKTVAAPGAFSKKIPGNGVTIGTTTAGLTWAASSRAASYEYCIDTTNNNSCDTGWVSTGAARSKSVSGLTPGTTYYWHVRATNGAGIKYSNSNAWWRFTT